MTANDEHMKAKPKPSQDALRKSIEDREKAGLEYLEKIKRELAETEAKEKK